MLTKLGFLRPALYRRGRPPLAPVTFLHLAEKSVRNSRFLVALMARCFFRQEQVTGQGHELKPGLLRFIQILYCNHS